MKELTIEDKYGADISIEDIIEFEKNYQISLPDYFREFLVKYAGTYPLECISKRECDVRHFFQLYPNARTSTSIKNALDANIFYDIKGYFPFATATSPSTYNFSLRDETYGQIWINQEEDNYETAEECFQFVANNLEEFVNGLERREDVPGW